MARWNASAPCSTCCRTPSHCWPTSPPRTKLEGVASGERTVSDERAMRRALKLAASLDGRIAAPDGASRWITGDEARADAHRLRAESDAVLVGAGTVKADDPELTVRLVPAARQPLRVVLGRAPAGARCQPALELGGDLADVLDELGRRDVLQLLVEGGAHVAGAFHRAGLVDRYIFYIAPALFGGDDARPMFAGAGAATMADVWRGHIVSVERLGDDLRVEL